MTSNEIIVAVYRTPHKADSAIHDLKTHGVPADAITLHAKHDISGQSTVGVPAPPEQHFFPRVFGYEPTPQAEQDELVYWHSLETGASVVVVHGPRPAGIDVVPILERHHPVDIDATEATAHATPVAGTRVRRYGG